MKNWGTIFETRLGLKRANTRFRRSSLPLSITYHFTSNLRSQRLPSAPVCSPSPSSSRKQAWV